MAYITKIDDRRVWIADEETGLAFGLSHFRHAMEQTDWPVLGVPGVASRKIDYRPFDLPAVHIFKIWADGSTRSRRWAFRSLQLGHRLG